jgi:hypothetical protein
MNYDIRLIENRQAEQELYLPYHYLSDQSAKHRPGQYTFGAFDGNRLIAACGFAGFPVPELFRSIWGVKGFKSFDQSGFHELSRLCIHPDYQITKGLASWFVSRCLKRLKVVYADQKKRCRAVLSYADNDQHSGVVYAACNFKYYGLTDKKFNIWTPCPPKQGGKYLSPSKRPGREEEYWKQQSRGWREHLNNGGIKVLRGQKHRFLIVWDKSLPPVLWNEVKWENNRAGQSINTHPVSTADLRQQRQQELF